MNITEVGGSGEGGRLLRVGVAMAEFNAFITEALLQGCLDALADLGVSDVTVARVAGALEVPLVCRRLARDHDAVVAIGAVIEGETDHYVHVATQASAGIGRVALDTGVPVGNAMLTVRDAEHARARSLPGPSNKGYEAAQAAVRAVRVLDEL